MISATFALSGCAVHTNHLDVYGRFVPKCYLAWWPCSVFRIVQLSNCSSCFCAAWFRDEHHAALMGKRRSHRSLGWHDGGSECVSSVEWSRDHHVYICMVWFRTTQYITMISAERSARGLDWQWSHFSRSLLCLYCMGFVMNTVPQWPLRVTFQKSLFTWWCFFSFFFFCEEVRFITIHALSRQVMTTTQPWSFWVAVLMDLMVDILRFSLWGLAGVVAMSVLCGTEMNELLANGDRHGSHPRVFCSVTLPVIVVWLQSRSQWWTLLYLRCMVLWWTLHHHDLWGTLLQKLCLTWFF